MQFLGFLGQITPEWKIFDNLFDALRGKMDSRVVAKSDELDRREVDEMLSRFADKKHGIAGTPSRPHFAPTAPIIS